MPKYKNCLKRVNRGNGCFDGGQTGRTRLDPSKPITACKVEKDGEGNIVYPIIVTQTLKIMNLGTVEYER